ncbi:MAG: transglutaminase N-terminal domain-containing protein [Caulobacteraceae bacterium]
MRLTVVHTTTYSFARPVRFNPHRLMLRPRGDQDLRVLDYALRCSPAAQLVESQDVFGNLVTTALFDQPADRLEIVSRLILETTAEAWPVFRIEPRAHAYPFTYSDDERADLGALCRPEHPHKSVAAWARTFVRSVPTDTLSLLKDLNAGMLAAATYRPRDEEGTQTASETLDLGSGSCRDLAALFIDAARHLGFGARAASGYLFDADDPSLPSGHHPRLGRGLSARRRLDRLRPDPSTRRQRGPDHRGGRPIQRRRPARVGQLRGRAGGFPGHEGQGRRGAGRTSAAGAVGGLRREIPGQA